MSEHALKKCRLTPSKMQKLGMRGCSLLHYGLFNQDWPWPGQRVPIYQQSRTPSSKKRVVLMRLHRGDGGGRSWTAEVEETINQIWRPEEIPPKSLTGLKPVRFHISPGYKSDWAESAVIGLQEEVKEQIKKHCNMEDNLIYTNGSVILGTKGR